MGRKECHDAAASLGPLINPPSIHFLPNLHTQHTPEREKEREMASLRRALFSTVPRILTSNRTSLAGPQSIHRPILGFVPRFCSSNESTQSLDIDLSSEESKRRLFNRLLYRSKQRGYLELDLILGKWVEDHIHSMDESGIKSLVHVLDLENPDLCKWLTGQEQPPEPVNSNPVFAAVREKVANNLDNHAAPETRATPGQAWVRGWDDFKKGRDGPIAGNQ
ncbi:hypothetical protein DH2020_018825 [Rehmannia glutinosa]|uniref:Succinate dehydrogenase assembly factor 2, mitochondrial n=1 Tax=Rehmannia glutinosa TaxID=99300 RepID=A0ABR0WK07_REHGL